MPMPAIAAAHLRRRPRAGEPRVHCRGSPCAGSRRGNGVHELPRGTRRSTGEQAHRPLEEIVEDANTPCRRTGRPRPRCILPWGTGGCRFPRSPNSVRGTPRAGSRCRHSPGWSPWIRPTEPQEACLVVAKRGNTGQPSVVSPSTGYVVATGGKRSGFKPSPLTTSSWNVSLWRSKQPTLAALVASMTGRALRASLAAT